MRFLIKGGALILLFTYVAVFIHYDVYQEIDIFQNGNNSDKTTEVRDQDLLIVSPHAKHSNFKEELKHQKALYYFSLGELASLQNEANEAIGSFKKALELDPSADHVHIRLAEEYIKKSEFEIAEKHLEQAIRLNNQSIQGHFLLGNIYAAKKKYEQAIRHYKKAIKLDSEKEQAYILLATVYAEKEEYISAAETLKALLIVKPTSFLAYYYLGRIYSDQGKHLLAEAEYKKALKIHPTFQAAAMALGMYYENKDEAEKAIEVYLNAIEDGADEGRLLRSALRLLVAKKDYQRVLKLLEDLKDQDPKDLNNRVRIGLIYYEMEKYDQAKTEFEELLKLYPDSDRLLFYVAAVYEKLGKIDKALSSLQKISSKSSFYKNAMQNSIVILMERKQYQEAVKLVKEMVEKNPSESEYYDLMASIYEKEEAYTQAIQILEEAIKKFPKEERLLYYLGIIYDKTGDLNKSLSSMQEILKRNPSHADALNFVGYTYIIQNVKLDEAEQMIRRALKLKPGYGYIEDSLGWVYYKKGNYSQALNLLEKAAKLRPEEAVIVDHLADTYVKMKKIEEAYELYQRALKLNPDRKTKESIEVKLKELSQHNLIKRRFPATDK